MIVRTCSTLRSGPRRSSTSSRSGWREHELVVERIGVVVRVDVRRGHAFVSDAASVSAFVAGRDVETSWKGEDVRTAACDGEVAHQLSARPAASAEGPGQKMPCGTFRLATVTSRSRHATGISAPTARKRPRRSAHGAAEGGAVPRAAGRSSTASGAAARLGPREGAMTLIAILPPLLPVEIVTARMPCARWPLIAVAPALLRAVVRDRRPEARRQRISAWPARARSTRDAQGRPSSVGNGAAMIGVTASGRRPAAGSARSRRPSCLGSASARRRLRDRRDTAASRPRWRHVLRSLTARPGGQATGMTSALYGRRARPGRPAGKNEVWVRRS